MATNYKIPDGRDLSDIFGSGDAGIYTGFTIGSGQTDLGRQFMAGSAGITTGYKNSAGIDLGSLFGADPYVSQGYTPCQLFIGTGGHNALGMVTKSYGYGVDGGIWFGSVSNTPLLGTSSDSSCIKAWMLTYGSLTTRSFAIKSTGSAQTEAIINGTPLPINKVYSEDSTAITWLNWFSSHVGQTITIYLS